MLRARLWLHARLSAHGLRAGRTRIEASILTARMEDLGKKLKVIEAKAVLLRDRLHQYQREETLRSETAETAEAAV